MFCANVQSFKNKFKLILNKGQEETGLGYLLTGRRKLLYDRQRACYVS